jgi:hypothetical protein
MIRRAKRMKTSQIDAAMEMLRSAGRNGDTELAHVNPREKAILRAMGGAGSRNPRTGLREYFVGGGDYNSGDARSFGGGDQTDAPSGMASPADGKVERDYLDSREYDFNLDGIMSDLRPQQEQTAQPAPQAAPRTGFFDSIGSYLSRQMENPDNIPGLGLTGMVIGPAMSGLNRAAREAGINVLDPSVPGERAAYEAGFPGNRDVADNAAAALGAVPVAAPAPAYLRGTPTTPPQEISSFIGPGMTDLQQRALISTYGTQGVNSAFRTDPVRRYYANLLSRGLISDRGVPVQQPYVLPIEQQYASMVLGRPMTNPSDAAAAYESIRGLL